MFKDLDFVFKPNFETGNDIFVKQDSIMVIPSMPWFQGVDSYNPDQFCYEKDLDCTWIARLQLLFCCTVRPVTVSSDGAPSEDTGAHLRLQLMYYSKFEDCNLTQDYPLQARGMKMLYDPSPTPVVFVGPVRFALCRAPLMPFFVKGNATPTIPSCFINSKAHLFPFGQADTKRNPGSKLFEVNDWMWKFGRPKTRGMSVTEAKEKRNHQIIEAAKKRSVTRKHNKQVKRKATDFAMRVEVPVGDRVRVRIARS